MTYKHNDESGVAMGWAVITLMLIFAAFLYAYSMGIINSLLNGPAGDQTMGYNHDVTAGKVSVQQGVVMSFGIGVITGAPWIILFAGIVYAGARAIYIKNGGT
jgi:hypothetical protein